MKNSKLRRILLTLACAVLLVSLSVGATLAYLTSTTQVVENTFSVGNVKITLDEAPVDEDGKATDGDRVMANNYHLLPAHEYDKDPTVHIAEGSEDCWIFVKVTNDISAIETKAPYGDDGATGTIAEQMTANGWTLVAGETNVYAYKEVVSAEDDIVVFESFKILETVSKELIATYAGKTITVQAYAVQEDGFDSSAAAWAAAKADWTKPDVTPAP